MFESSYLVPPKNKSYTLTAMSSGIASASFKTRAWPKTRLAITIARNHSGCSCSSISSNTSNAILAAISRAACFFFAFPIFMQIIRNRSGMLQSKLTPRAMPSTASSQ